MSPFDDIAIEKASVSRRRFIGTSSGLAFAFTFGAAASAPSARAQGAAQPGRLNAYVDIAADGRVTIKAPAPEMGQGVLTVLPLIVAEELDADWSKVKVEQSPIHADYNHPIFKAQYVVASLSVVGYWTPLRVAGAQARRVLIDAAAERWKVPAAELTTEPGMVVHEKTKRKMSYGQIAAFAKAPAALPKIDPAKDLKPADKYRLLGKDTARVDVAAKTTGAAKYGIDATVPGMVYAALVLAPSRGGALESSNADDLKKMKGVQAVVPVHEGLAIVGATMEAVAKARRELKAKWKPGPAGAWDSAKELAAFQAHARDASLKGEVWRTKGDVGAGLAGAATTISSEFLNDPVYHAQIEPMNCTAWVKGDTVEIWVGTQAPTRTQIDVAKALGTTPEKIIIHQQMLGGGFGRRAFVDTSVHAAVVSKAVGKPVKLIILREDDVASGNYRPMTAQKIDVGLDKDGKIVGWRHRVVGEPVADYLYGAGRLKASNNKDIIFINGAETPHYAIEPHYSEALYQPEKNRVGAWRGIGAGYTKFAIESVIDEIAHARKMDPVALRVSLAANPRAKRAIEKAAEMAEWTKKREGRGLGIALAEYFASIAVGVAEISVDRQSGKIRVHNYWVSVDAGLPLQPANIAAQVEGGIVFGLSAALKERITIKDGATTQSNFHDYEVLRMEEMPEIRVEVLRSPPNPMHVGELGVPTAAPAVANAFFALTGKRLRHLPFTPDRVLEALKA